MKEMGKMRRLVIPTIAAVLIATAALAANTTFFTNIGDLVFPFSPPKADGTAGAIDNMIIGATTKRAATFTTVTADALAGAAVNANFASPGPIGSVAPNAGTFTTLRTTGLRTYTQGSPVAATTSATLTAANLLVGIITVNQGAAGASAQQLPLATDLDTALPNAVAGDAFDFSVINISTMAAESASLTTNTGWTLVGDMDVSANSAATTKSAGRFRARKTGTGAWVLYRLS